MSLAAEKFCWGACLVFTWCKCTFQDYHLSTSLLAKVNCRLCTNSAAKNSVSCGKTPSPALPNAVHAAVLVIQSNHPHVDSGVLSFE